MVEVNFESREFSWLDTVLQEMTTSEQSQEIKLPDGMPDIGQVLCAWGQPIVRGKEWRSDSVSLTGGMMVWVMYLPEDNSGVRCIDAWIPFQMKWDLPAGAPEGSIRLKQMARFVDARSVSPRKIMVRCGMAAAVTAMAEKQIEVYAPSGDTQGVKLLKVTYPIRLPQEIGEKTFLIDETLSLPESTPQPEKIFYYRFEPRITDKKVLTGKLVFRGNGLLHVLYAGKDGRLNSWDFEVPFSQYTDLSNEHSSDAQADIIPNATSLELELEENGNFRVKCGMVAQYLITDKVLLETIEDAYCPGREIEMQSKILELPVLLENRREMVYAEQALAAGASGIVDTCFLPDFPRSMRMENGVSLSIPGNFQTLYYDEEGALRSASSRWEGNVTLPSDENSSLSATVGATVPQANPGSGGIQLKAEIPIDVTATADQGFPMVTGVKLGQECRLDPGRPSLILRRAGTKRLWDIAKDSGSTVEAIQQANGLQGEPVPGQMLLIPVP